MKRNWRSRLLRGLLLFLGMYFGLGTAVVWTGQWVFRHRVGRLLADVQGLGVGTGGWAEFQAFQKRWGSWGSSGGTCAPSACNYDVLVTDWTPEALYPSWLNRWKDPWKYSFPVEYASWPLLRVCRAKRPFGTVSVRIVDGLAATTSASLFLTAEPGLPGNWGFEEGHGGFSLVAGFNTQRGHLHTGRNSIPEWPETAAVSDIEVRKPSGCMNCVAIYTVFDEKADPKVLEPLLKVDMSCITRWAYCQTEADIMPAAWERYEAEHARQRVQEKKLEACDYPANFLYEQADNAVLMRVTDEKDGDGARTLRNERKLKGAANLSPGSTYSVFQEEVGAVRPGLERAGEDEVVLFPGTVADFAPSPKVVEAYRCGVMPLRALKDSGLGFK